MTLRSACHLVLLLCACSGLPAFDAGSDVPSDAGVSVDGGTGAAGMSDAGHVTSDAGLDAGTLVDGGSGDAGPVRRGDAGWPVGGACLSHAPERTEALGVDSASLFAGVLPVSNRLVALARSPQWTGTAWLSVDGGPGLTLRGQALDGGAVFVTRLATQGSPEQLSLTFEQDRLVAAWVTSQHVQAAVWTPSPAGLVTRLDLGSVPPSSAVDVALAAQPDGGVSALWRGESSDGGAALFRRRVQLGAPTFVQPLAVDFRVGALDVLSSRDGAVVAWERGLAWLGPDLDWRESVALPAHASGLRLAFNASTGAVALARLSGGRRPTLSVDEVLPDGGFRPLFEHHDGAYSTTTLRNSLALAACGRGFVVVFRDDATHRRGFPSCGDEEYCLTNDLRAAAFTALDAGVQEWFLTPSGPRQTERALSPALLPTEDGGALDVAWVSQPVDDVARVPGAPSAVFAAGRLRCDCAVP